MFLLALLACGTDKSPSDDTAVAETCTPEPLAEWNGETAFEEQTSAWGLDGIQGVRLAAADLDGDGYADLFAHDGTGNARDDVAGGVLHHNLLMNRDDGAGGRTFVDTTIESGVLTNRDGTQGISSNVHVFGDVDNDGDLDLFAGRGYDAGAEDQTGDCSEIYLNDGTGHFALTSVSSEICDPVGYPTASATFVDADADGILDLWVVGWYVEYGASYEAAQANLFHGRGDGTFVSVTDDADLKQHQCGTRAYCTERDDRYPAYGAAACDVNGDAMPDLVKANYGRSWNNLWLNQGDATFVDIGEESHYASDDDYDYSDNLMYACYCETHECAVPPTVRCGGAFPDTYWTPGYDDLPARNNGNSFTSVCSDIDNDGDADMYTAEIRHMWAGDSADSTQLLLNDGTGIFDRIENDDDGLARSRPTTSDWNEGDLYAAFVDFDSDGWKDILLGTSDYPDTHMWLWRQVSPGQFEDVSESTGMDQPWPAGLAVADFDRDGDIDVITGSSIARSGTPWTDHQLHMYVNVLPRPNYVRITGLPMGTRVDVTSGGVTQTQEVSGGYGVGDSQNDVPLTFGLGESCMIDSIVATKPGGATKTWDDVAGNQERDLGF
jgi:hypothetical protein